MEYIIIALQIIVALSILNVWLIQPKQPTRWRGGDAETIVEEFQVYGLPKWFCYLIGTLKVSLAILLLVGIWYPAIRHYAAVGLAILLLGSIVMHIKVKDPWIKSLPAFIFMVLSLIIAFLPHYHHHY